MFYNDDDGTVLMTMNAPNSTAAGTTTAGADEISGYSDLVASYTLTGNGANLMKCLDNFTSAHIASRTTTASQTWTIKTWTANTSPANLGTALKANMKNAPSIYSNNQNSPQ